MILQSLVSLYDRLAADPATSAKIAKQGFAPKSVSFEIVLRTDGHAVINDLRIAGTKIGKSFPRDIVVPTFPGKRTSGVKAGFLCDKTSYLFGCPDPGEAAEGCRSAEEFGAFRDLHLAAQQVINHPAFDQVCDFLRTLDPSLATNHPLWPEIGGKNGVFRLEGEQRYVHEIPVVADYWACRASCSTKNMGICLATGQEAPIAEVHPPIKGVIDPGGQAEKGIVGFNKDSFISYGKKQSLNAPVSELAAFKYATALNWLLDGPRPQRLRIGDTTAVFWSQQRTEAESLIGYLLGGQPANDPAAQDATLNQRLAVFLDILRQGGGRLADLGNDVQTPFYILGLAPNAARISIRFWYTSTLGELLQHLKRHRDDLAIQTEYPDRDSDFPPVWMLLDEIVPRKQGRPDRDKIPPLLGGAITRAILAGGPYPQAFATAVLRRIRIDAADSDRRTHVTYLRAALLKAFLNRNHQKAMKEALDPNRPEPAYHLGRLFAVYETAQRHAHDWQLERTIRETLYSAASAAPLGVFGRLERLFHHHTHEKRFPVGSSVSYADIAAEIAQNFHGTPVYPASLDLPDQALFSVGYYHQLHFFSSLSAAKRADSAPAAKTAPTAASAA
jgi:CRISPR-associated protein Csd1